MLPALRHRHVPSGDGVDLHVVEAGPEDGRPALLLHGFPDYWRGWDRQIGPLAEAGHRVLVPDGRGYDESGKPAGLEAYRLERLVADVLAVADGCGASRFDLVGHDWGGVVALAVAALHPERVSRLAVLNGPHPDAWARRARTSPIQALRSLYVAFFQLPRVPEAVLAAGDYAALRIALTSSARPGAFSPEDLAGYRDAWAKPGALTGMLGWYRAARLPRKPLPRITVPTLILWGRQDPALQPENADDALALCDDGRVVWFDEASHFVQRDAAEAISAALLDFLRTGTDASAANGSRA